MTKEDATPPGTVAHRRYRPWPLDDGNPDDANSASRSADAAALFASPPRRRVSSVTAPSAAAYDPSGDDCVVVEGTTTPPRPLTPRGAPRVGDDDDAAATDEYVATMDSAPQKALSSDRNCRAESPTLLFDMATLSIAKATVKKKLFTGDEGSTTMKSARPMDRRHAPRTRCRSDGVTTMMGKNGHQLATLPIGSSFGSGAPRRPSHQWQDDADDDSDSDESFSRFPEDRLRSEDVAALRLVVHSESWNRAPPAAGSFVPASCRGTPDMPRMPGASTSMSMRSANNQVSKKKRGGARCRSGQRPARRRTFQVDPIPFDVNRHQ